MTEAVAPPVTLPTEIVAAVPVSPLGIEKLRMAALEVPEFVMAADVPEAVVVTVPKVIVAGDQEGPVAPVNH